MLNVRVGVSVGRHQEKTIVSLPFSKTETKHFVKDVRYCIGLRITDFLFL